MPLATKNGSIIVKDGKLAENCGCCGGWYCYDGICQCPVGSLASVTVSLACSSHLKHTTWADSLSNKYYETKHAWLSSLNGSHSLLYNGSSWQKTYYSPYYTGGFACNYATISLAIGAGPNLYRLTVACPVYAYAIQGTSPLHFSPGAILPAPNGWVFAQECNSSSFSSGNISTYQSGYRSFAVDFSCVNGVLMPSVTLPFVANIDALTGGSYGQMSTSSIGSAGFNRAPFSLQSTELETGDPTITVNSVVIA